MQDSWEKSLEKLIYEIPEDLGNDPSEEKLRQQGIEKVRNQIARKWIALRTMASVWHAAEREEALTNTRDHIAKLISIHGAHFEFSPDADFLVPMPGITKEEVARNQVDDVQEIVSSSSKSSQSSHLPHRFMFLQVRGDVWTCLEAITITDIGQTIKRKTSKQLTVGTTYECDRVCNTLAGRWPKNLLPLTGTRSSSL